LTCYRRFAEVLAGVGNDMWGFPKLANQTNPRVSTFQPESPSSDEVEYDLIVATTVPSVRAVITLRPTLAHPRWPNRGRYMPHVAVGHLEQREAKILGNTITEHCLGVLLADAPDEIPPGGSAEVTLRLMYWPGETYEQLVPGATFTIREGPRIIGFGRVLSADP
jgi:hypothetical protein